MSSLLEELKNDFGFKTKNRETILQIQGWSWKIERIPFFLLENYEYLVRKYTEDHALASLSIVAINNHSIETIFEATDSGSEENRKLASFRLCEFLYTKIDHLLIKNITVQINEEFFQNSIDSEDPSEIFNRFMSDPKISMMLYLMDKYHWHFNDVMKYSSLQLNLIYRYALDKEGEEKKYVSDLLGRHLGTTWSADDFFSKHENKGPQDKVFIPLSMIIESKLPEYLKKILRASTQGTSLNTGASPRDLGPSNQVVDMGTLSPKEFMDMIINRKAPETPQESDQKQED